MKWKTEEIKTTVKNRCLENRKCESYTVGTKPNKGTTKNAELYGRKQKSRCLEITVRWKWICQGHEIIESVRCCQRASRMRVGRRPLVWSILQIAIPRMLRVPLYHKY